jgi:hypothetical protein
MEPLRPLLENYGKPLAMTVFAPLLMGFGVVNLTGTINDVLRIGSAFFGFLTSLTGFVAGCLCVAWWIKRNRNEANKRKE